MASNSVVYVPVMGSFRGMGAQFAREMSGAARTSMRTVSTEMERGGRDAGQRAGQATAQGIASQRRQIERASRVLASARQSEADAAGQVRVAEERLRVVRSQSGASAATVARAEERLAGAQRRHTSATQQIASASSQLDRIRRGEATVSQTVLRAEANLSTARNNSANAAGRLRVAEVQLSQAQSSGTANSAQIAAAEERVAAARRNVATAGDQVRSRELLLTAAQRDAANAATATASATAQAGEQMDAAGERTGRLRSGLASVASGFGAVAATAAGGLGVAGVIGSFTSAITVGNDLTNSLNTLSAVSGASGAEMAQVSARARELANDVSLPATSAGSATAAMVELAKGGFNVKQSMDAARGTLQLAAAAQIDAAQAATIQSQALQAFGKNATYASTTADILANAANASSAEIVDVASALQQSGTVANQFGVSMQDTASAIAMMANAGIRGSDAGTLLKSALLALTDQGNPAQGAIEKLGLTVYDAQGKFVGLQSLFGQLQKASKSMSAEQYQAASATLFGSDAMRIAGIAAQQGAGGFAKMNAAVGRQGAAADVAAAKTQGLPGAFERAKNAVEDFMLSVYNVIKAPLAGALTGITFAFQVLSSAVGLLDPAFRVLGATANTVGGFISRNRGVFIALAGVITAIMLPNLIIIGVAFTHVAAQATASGIAQARAWLVAQAGAVKAAAVSVVQSWRIVAGWVAQGGAATAQGARVAAGWAVSAAGAARSAVASVGAGARIVATWVAQGAAATANAAKSAAAWVVASAGAGTATVRTVAYGIASKAVRVATLAWAGAQWVLNAAMSANPVGLIIAAIVALVAAVVLAWRNSETFRNIVMAAWNGIKIAIAAVWNWLSTSVFPFFKAALSMIGAAAMWLWQNVITPAWNGIKAVIGVVWTIIKGYFTAWVMIFRNVIAPVVMWIWNSIIAPAFRGIGAVIGFVWNSIIKPAFDALQAAVRAVGDVFTFVWNRIIKPAWDALGAGIRFVIDNIVKPAFNGLRSALQAVGDFFGTIVDGIGAAWDKVKGFVAKPINFVIGTVWNNGLLKGWNIIAGFLPGLREMKPLGEVAFAQGGPVPMVQGATRGKDSVSALLMPDEHVWNVQDVRRAGGQGAMYRMRSMVDAGRPFTWTPGGLAAARGDGLPRFADGGAVTPGAKLSPGPGEGGLQDIAKLFARIIKLLWPKGVSSIGGWRPPDGYNEHSSGRALDVMVNDKKTGDQVKDFSMANSPKYPVQWTLWDQKSWTPPNQSSGMPDRGSPTQNHMDHDHVFYAPQSVNPNVVPQDIITDGFGGPSAADMMKLLKQRVTEVLDKLLNPIKQGLASIVGTPPPEWLGIPPKVLDETKTKAVEAAFGMIDKLGDKLKEAYDKAKGLASIVGKTVVSAGKSVIGGVTGLFRDRGGYLPAGQSVVTNETGRPEAVFNWDQLELLKKLLELAKATGESALKETTGGIAEFFGFKPVYDKLAEAVEARIKGTADQAGTGLDATSQSGEALDQASQSGQATDQATQSGDATGQTGQSDEAIAQTQQSGDTTTQQSTRYTDPTYGDPNARIGDQTYQLDKMPDLAMEHKYDPKGGAEQWRPMAIEAIKRVGLSTAKPQVDAMIKQIQSESGGDPNIAQQITDVNGTGEGAGVGLLQIIPTTFAAHRDPALPNDRRNPFANMVAALRYYKSRYGSDLTAQWGQGHGYDRGGWLMPGITMAVNATRKPEAILTAGQWESIDSMLEALPSAGEFKAAADAKLAATPLRPSDAEPDTPAGGRGREVHNHFHTEDVSGAVRGATREQRRLARSDALVGGY